MNPLNSITGTIISGVVLALAIVFGLSTGTGNPIEWTIWAHVLVGITWIGLLYYFNFVQVPAVGAALADADHLARTRRLVKEGIAQFEAGFISAAHSDEDIAATLEAARASFAAIA